MKLFLIMIVSSLLFLISTNTGQAEEAPILTLQECISIAVEKNPTLLAAKEGIRGTVYHKEAAFTDFLPKLEAGYDYNHAHRTRTSVISGQEVQMGTHDQYGFSLSAKQPVFKGGYIRYTYQLAKLGVDISKVNYARLKQDLLLQVKTTYYDILRADKIKLEAEQSVKRLTQHLRDARAFFEVGLIAKNEVLQSEVELAQSRQDLVRAEQALKLAVSQMNILLQNDIDKPLKLVDILNYQPYHLEFQEGLQKAHQQRPEIKEANLAVAQAEKSIELAGSQYYPNIDLSLSYTKEGDSADLHTNPYGLNENATAYATLSWTFWEWGKTKKLVAESNAKLNESRHTLTQIRDSVSLEVKQAFLDLEEAEKNISVAKTAIAQAEENYRINTEKYKVQVATSTDVLDAQTLLTQAKTNYYNALSQYNIAKNQVEWAIGELDILKSILLRKSVDTADFFCHSRHTNSYKIFMDYQEEKMADLFEKVKKDLKKGIEEGIAVVKEGAIVVSQKVSELTAEGKRRYNIFDLKAKIQNQMAELGGKTYDVLIKKKSPAVDSKVKSIMAKIKKLEGQLLKLEGKKEEKAAPKKKPAAKTKVAAKKTARPAAKKTT